MRSSLVAAITVTIATCISSTTALQALSSSPCAAQCGNVLGSTTGDDISCPDSTYGSVLTANIFKGCVSCQLTSRYVDAATRQTDLQWGLYNLRFAVSWCLFGFPNNNNTINTPCITERACGGLESAFEYDSLSANSTAYGYCTLVTPRTSTLPSCSNCLASGSEFYLTNFVTALYAACEQQPIPGQTISLDGSLFEHVRVNVTSPTALPTSTAIPTAGGLSLGGKIGIAMGAIITVLIVTGFCIVWRGKRRRRRFLAAHQQQSGYADWLAMQQAAEVTGDRNMSGGGGSAGAGGFFDSPQSQRPLVAAAQPPWAQGIREDDSPHSAIGEKVYFSPYSSQYSSPVSASEQVKVVSREWPIDRKGTVTQEWPMDRKGSVGGRGETGRVPSRSRSRDREAEGDRIEMYNIPPVLIHPGHGRGHLGGLSEADARRGDAL